MSKHHAIYMRVSTKRQDTASQEPERWRNRTKAILAGIKTLIGVADRQCELTDPQSSPDPVRRREGVFKGDEGVGVSMVSTLAAPLRN